MVLEVPQLTRTEATERRAVGHLEAGHIALGRPVGRDKDGSRAGLVTEIGDGYRGRHRPPGPAPTGEPARDGRREANHSGGGGEGNLRAGLPKVA
jgi:hypothetical protein